MIQPQNFLEWKNCIEVKCKITLDKDFVNNRIEALTDLKDPQTEAFIKLYGDDYRLQVLNWFKQAQN